MVISGGGTGGHLSPALALGAQLQRMRPDCELLFIGTESPLDEQFLARGGFPYRLLPGAGIAGHNLRQRLRAIGKLGRATLAARRLLKQFKPALVVGVGGYASMPAGLAALSLRIPLVLMEQNTRPGLTNRLLARFAARICVAFPQSQAMLPREGVEVTGNPVRFQPVNNPYRQPENFSILVLGGSSGAHRLNIGALFAFTSLRKAVINFTVVHQTGSADEGLVRSGYQQAGITARVTPFIDDMAAALAAADLVVARAGAMTVSELALAGRPSILVPYPFHRDHQQQHNARTLEEVGAAIIVPDDDQLGANLSAKLLELHAAPARLAKMAQRALSAARPDAAVAIARTCLEIAEAR